MDFNSFAYHFLSKFCSIVWTKSAQPRLYQGFAGLVLFYHIHSFMPKEVLTLDYPPRPTSNKESNLYQIAFGDLWVWCVGSELLTNEQLKKILATYENNTENIISIWDKDSAHASIQRNRKPDLVVLIPPDNKDSGFEDEVSAIKTSLTELYFVYCTNPTGFYNNEWFETNISGQGKKFTCYSANSVMEALIHAFCLRTFEILRKELLEPIPLFSLAPTHFSASYDFQLGEPLEICFDYINEHNDDSKNLRASLSFIIHRIG